MWSGKDIKALLAYYKKYDTKNKTIMQNGEIEQIDFEQEQLNNSILAEVEQKELEAKKIQEKENEKESIRQKHLNCVLRQLNEFASNYIPELEISAKLEYYNGLDDKKYHIVIWYSEVNNKAEACAEHVAEMAYIYLSPYTQIKDLTKIDVFINGVNEL